MNARQLLLAIQHPSNSAAGSEEDEERGWKSDHLSLGLAIRRPNGSGYGSEEEEMSRIALSTEGVKLMKLCDTEGFEKIEDLLIEAITDSVCPGICMTEGCDYTMEIEPDQQEGYCEACGGNTVVSALVLAGASSRRERDG